MTLLIAIVGGSVAGFVLGLTLDRAYRDGSGSTGAATRRQPTRRRLVLLPAAGAAIAALVWSSTSGPADVMSTAAVAFILLALAATDFERHLLPNRLTYPAIPIALLLAPWLPAGGYVPSMLGAALGFGTLLAVYVAAPRALGAGDVKLAALIGAFAGAQLVFTALTVGAVIGAVVCLVIFFRQHQRGATAVAYGPYLVVGALFVCLA